MAESGIRRVVIIPLGMALTMNVTALSIRRVFTGRSGG